MLTNPEHVSCWGGVKALPQIAKAKHSPWGWGFVPQSPHVRVLWLAGVGMWDSPELLEVQEGHTRPLGSSGSSATTPLPPRWESSTLHPTPHPGGPRGRSPSLQPPNPIPSPPQLSPWGSQRRRDLGAPEQPPLTRQAAAHQLQVLLHGGEDLVAGAVDQHAGRQLPLVSLSGKSW